MPGLGVLESVSDRVGLLMHGGTVRGLAGPPSEGRLRDAVEGKVVLVTGSSAGTGKAVARRLGAAGATVLLVARRQERLEEVAADIEAAGGTAHVHPADLSDVDAAGALGELLLERHGAVDVVVNNAGLSIRRSVELSYDRFHDFDRTIRINYLGPVRLLLTLLPAMRERGGGHIVNVSTIGVQFPDAPRYTAYLASKGAFDIWLRGLAPEVRGDGVACTSMYFGLVHTAMSGATSMYRYMPGLSPDRAATDVAWAIVERPTTTGPLWARLGGLAADAARGAMEPALGLYYRASQDSARARGAQAGEEERDVEIPVLGQLGRLAGRVLP
jgi:short-subunit dehydrogenase